MRVSILRFINRYFLVALAVGLLMLPIYLEAFSLLEENEEKNIDWKISKGMDILNNEITSINNVTVELQKKQYFGYVKYLEKINESSDYYALMALRENLSDMTSSFSFAVEPMIYFPNEMIFCRSTVYSSEVQNSYATFHSEINGSLENWFGQLATEVFYYEFLPADTFYSANIGANRAFEGIPYIYSYGVKGQAEHAFFIVLLPVDTLLELWGLSDIREIASIKICDTDTGKLLYTNQVEIEGRSRHFQGNSSGSGLQLRVELPRNYFWDKLSDLVGLAILYLIIFLGLTIVGALLVAYKNMKPLRKIISTLDKYTDKPHFRDNEDYDYIIQSISEIGDEKIEYKSKHKRLDEEIAHWMLREQILNGLDSKQFEKLEEIYKNMERPFRLFIVHITHTEWEYSSTELQELLQHNGMQFVFCSKVKPNLFVLLYAGEVTCERIELCLNRFQVTVRQEWQCDCTVYISTTMDQFEELSISYQAGRLNMKCYSDRCLIFQDVIEKEETESLTDLNLMENVRLTDLILDGREKEAGELIKTQWEKVNQAHEYFLLEQLFFMQTAVLNSIAVKLESKMYMNSLEYSDNLSVMKQKVLDFSRELCGLANQNKENRKNDISRQIMEYIGEHYNEPDFYIGSCVEAFGISDKTIARAVKMSCNQTFAKYLEQLRMQKATQMLEDTDLDIEYIANASGFTSVNTFFKVFKRIYGVSPSTYRQHQRWK